jgi:hypothetical protein
MANFDQSLGKILLRGVLALSIVLSVVVSAAHAVPPADRGGAKANQPGTVSQAPAGQDNAAKQCKAERASLGEKAFAEKYGTNPNKRNAFGKCVSGKAKKPGDATAKPKDEGEKQENAARKCRAERAAMGEKAFAEKYGTNPNKRNAFGKCVSKYAKPKPAKPKPAKP